MKTFIEKVQEFLLNEFEKRGVTNVTSLHLEQDELIECYMDLTNCPKDLNHRQIICMMKWLEINKIKINKTEIICMIGN